MDSVQSYGEILPDGYGGFVRKVTYSCGCNGEYGDHCFDCGSATGTYTRIEDCSEFDDY